MERADLPVTRETVTAPAPVPENEGSGVTHAAGRMASINHSLLSPTWALGVGGGYLPTVCPAPRQTLMLTPFSRTTGGLPA